MRENAVKIYFLFFLLLLLILFSFSACFYYQKTDLRAFAPADAIAYLETDDLSNTLNALTENKAFQQIAAAKPDFSALKNVQVAVILTNFESTENQISNENAVLNFKPHFVAVAETHAWQWQTTSLVENQLNKFVVNSYGPETKFEENEKTAGKWFTWTANDGRKIFAFVQNSRIFFGSDADVIEKCLAAKRGETESLLKNESFTRAYEQKSENNLAFGYVSPEGVAQIADLAGVAAAVETSEDVVIRSFIAQTLPQIVRNTTKEIVWTAQKSEYGIEDNYSISLNPETVSVVKETLAPIKAESDAEEFLPADFYAATSYKLKNPLIAWRSLLFLTAKNTDSLNAKLLLQFSDNLLESYGITNAEVFFSAVDSEIITAQFDSEGEKSVVITGVKDFEKIKNSLTAFDFKKAPEILGNARIWKAQDGESAAGFIENKLILGDAESVFSCLKAKQSEENFTKNSYYKMFDSSRATAATFGKDTESAEKIVEVFAQTEENKKVTTYYLTETRFTDKGIERKTVSPFGLVGKILEQLSE